MAMFLYKASFFFLLFSAHADPCESRCTCVMPRNQPLEMAVPQAVASADAVFSGSVVSVEPPDYAAVLAGTGRGEFRVRLKMERSWKGPTADTLHVYTFAHAEMCGFEFVRGARYLVYAGIDAHGTLSASSCSRTAALNSVLPSEIRLLERIRGSGD